MAIVTKFTGDVQAEIDGCPLADPVPDPDQSACGECSYNLVSPGRPRIGCVMRTPVGVYDAALTRLAARAPALHAELSELIKSAQSVPPGPTSPVAARWLDVARRWDEQIAESGDDPDELEVVRLVGRFARAALDLEQPVQILG